jgi:biotin operon repressor
VTPKEQQTLDALRRLTVGAVSPSLDVIASEIGSSKSHVHKHLASLKAKGVVDWKPRSWRSITIVREGPTREQMARWSSAELSRVRAEAYAILDERLDQPAGAGHRRVSA